MAARMSEEDVQAQLRHATVDTTIYVETIRRELARARESEAALLGMLKSVLREADARIANDPEWWAQAEQAQALIAQSEGR